MLKKLIDKIDSYRRGKRIIRKKRQIIHANSFLKKVSIPMDIANQYQENWSVWHKPDLDWIRIYAGINNQMSPLYVPENFYYNYFEPRLNNRLYTLAYADKNLYTVLFNDCQELLPKIYLQKINGSYYEKNRQIISKKIASNIFTEIGEKNIFVKPASETSGGRGAMVLTKKGIKKYNNTNDKFTFDDLDKLFPNNFVIQEKITQHDFFSSFNKTSVNTIRVFTYRSVRTNEVHVLHSILRVGKEGSIVDNQAAGGQSVGIKETGILNNFAVTKKGHKSDKINDVSLLEEHQVPEFKRVLNTAIKLAPLLPYHRFVAFDFCITHDNNIKLLEINLKNIEINFLQMNNGPLFGAFTKEISEYCKKAPKSVILDFYV